MESGNGAKNTNYLMKQNEIMQHVPWGKKMREIGGGLHLLLLASSAACVTIDSLYKYAILQSGIIVVVIPKCSQFHMKPFARYADCKTTTRCRNGALILWIRIAQVIR